MATPLLGLYAPATNADPGAWGGNWNNTGTTTIENVIASVQTASLSTGTVTLSAAQTGAQMLTLTGNLSGNVILTNGGNLWNGIRCFENLTTPNGFTVTLSQNGTVVVPAGRRCLAFLDTSNGPRLISAISTSGAPDVPSGTVSAFYMASAPTGWTISAGLNDYGMRIVNGTTQNTGGTTPVGSTAYSTIQAQTSTGGYTLLITDIPSHAHPFTGLVLAGTGTFFYTSGTNNDPTGVVGNTGGGGAHSHSVTFGIQTADFILATKN